VRVLALDLSINKPGYAIADTQKNKVITFGHLKNNSSEGVYRRIDKNLQFFLALIPKHQIKAVWLELPAFSGRQKSHDMLTSQQGVFKYALHKRNIPVYGISISDIKKHVTGKGTATKDEMVKAIRSKGYQVNTDDEADAIGIYLTGYEKPFLDQVNQ